MGHTQRLKRPPYTLSVKLAEFTVWRHTGGENWVNCVVLTGNSAGFRTALSSRLSHRELRSSLRESHSFLSLPSDTTKASSQGTSLSSNSVSRRASHDTFVFIYHFWLHILRFLFFFSDRIMADVASKQHKKTQRTHKKLTNLMGNLCCAKERSIQFFVQFFTQLNCTV